MIDAKIKFLIIKTLGKDPETDDTQTIVKEMISANMQRAKADPNDPISLEYLNYIAKEGFLKDLMFYLQAKNFNPESFGVPALYRNSELDLSSNYKFDSQKGLKLIFKDCNGVNYYIFATDYQANLYCPKDPTAANLKFNKIDISKIWQEIFESLLVVLANTSFDANNYKNRKFEEFEFLPF